MVIFDTDVMIELLRENERAKQAFLRVPHYERFTTAVNVMELYAGARNEHDLFSLRRFVKRSFEAVLHISPRSSAAALHLVEKHVFSGMRVADALIAAVAMGENATLLTGNDRHFRSVENLSLEVFAPRN